jgi:Histidine kinase-, DNA gyrase B-, and HSP90-like ATPase
VPRRLSQRNLAADRDAAVDGWHELSVANPTFLLERLGGECTDLQGLRELTVNAMDAIAALGDRAGGRVVWDVDWLRFEASGGRVRKLAVTDTGTGMTPGQLREYINQLASSGREQSAAGNFGVGAKVAAGSRNPHGLEYRSWHRGQGALVRFKRHPDGRWGLEPQRWTDGRSDFWRPLDEHEKPWLLRGHDHGTQVVLLGRQERHDTTQPPESVTDGRR